MKQSKELDRIQEQMKPGIISHGGFLGSDTRKLGDIIEQDNEAVKRMDLTHKKIASRLAAIRDAGKKGLGTAISLEGRFDVRVDAARGKLPCPFHHPGLFLKTFTIVSNRETGAEIIFTDMSLHLIEEHGFYGGKGSAHRLDPELLARELGIR